jgi:hypothetical protein
MKIYDLIAIGTGSAMNIVEPTGVATKSESKNSSHRQR